MSHTRSRLSWAMQPLAAALLSTLAVHSHAVSIGIDPLTTPVVNPFTGLSTDVWKLVGRSSGCTAELITPQWVLSSAHCAAAGYYYNDHLAPGVAFPLMSGQTAALPQDPQWPICAVVTEPDPSNPSARRATDMYLCRLSNPAPIPNAPAFPPLVAGPIRGPLYYPTLPSYAQIADRSASFGTLMIYGHGNGGNKVAFMTFSGLPYGYSPITDPTGSTLPDITGGDSGGGVYSYSPITGTWAMAGITTTPLQFFTEEAIAFIQSHIAQYGDTPPASVSTASHYGDPTARSAADLPAPPAAAGMSGGSLIVRWNAPADPSVTSYNVTIGHDKQITTRTTVGATAPLQVSIPVSGARYWTACVQPVNPRGAGNAAWVTERYPVPKFLTPGCSTFDAATPGTVSSISMSSLYNSSTGLYKVSASWAKPTVPDVAIGSYRVTTTTTYPSGPKRVVTTEVKTPSSSVNVVTGSTVCTSVAAISAIGVVGPASSPQCTVAR